MNQSTIIIIITTVILTFTLIGCASTPEETNEFRNTIRPIKNIISVENDLQIYLKVSHGFLSHDIENIIITSIPNGSLEVCSGAYTHSYKGSKFWTCQDGISYVDFHGNSTYSTKMSFKGLNRLRSDNMPSMFPRTFWAHYKEQLIDLSHTAKISYIKQKEYLASLDINDRVLPLGIGLANRESYSFKELKDLIKKAGEVDTIAKLLKNKVKKIEQLQIDSRKRRAERELEKRNRDEVNKQLLISRQNKIKIKHEKFNLFVEDHKRTWNNRHNKKYNIGDEVCSFKSNKKGNVEQVNANNIKVWWTKEYSISRNYIGQGLFFGSFSFSDFNDNFTYNLLHKSIDKYEWVTKNEISSCTID